MVLLIVALKHLTLPKIFYKKFLTTIRLTSTPTQTLALTPSLTPTLTLTLTLTLLTDESVWVRELGRVGWHVLTHKGHSE